MPNLEQQTDIVRFIQDTFVNYENLNREHREKKIV